MEKIAVQDIEVQVEASNWQEAITKAGQLLADDHKIDIGYIDSMIQAVNQLGPYIVLMPEFALAHAAPSSHVKETSISLITLKKPVYFGSKNDPVSIVMCIACVDKTSHMELLQEVAKKLMTDGILNKMKQCRTSEELYALFN